MNTETISEDTETPSLAEVLRTAIEYHLLDTRVGVPGRVLAYDAESRTATIQPMVGRHLKKQDGTEVEEKLPAIPGVPVEFPGAGKWNVVWPLAEGDVGVLHFHDSSLEEWKGAANRDVIAKDVRMHALADATFRPGLRSPSGPGVAPRTDAMVFGILDGIAIHITESGISLGEANAAYAVAKAETVKVELGKVQQALGALTTAFNSHTHLYAPGPGAPVVTGPSVPQGVAPAAVGDMGSTTVKVKG